MTKSVPDQSNSIAVVGMACVFPGAHSPEELFENILAGRRYFRKSPKERLPSEDYYDPDPLAPGKTYTDLIEIKKYMVETGSYLYCKSKILAFITDAEEILETLKISPKYKKMLHSFIEDIADKTSHLKGT